MKHCFKCNKSFSKDKTYCDSCGKKLKHNKKEYSHKKHNPPYKFSVVPWAIPWIVLGVLLIIAIAIILPTKAVSYKVEVPYIDTEQYTVDVPYEDVEEYTVQVPYETKEQYVESVPVQKEEQIRYSREWVKCSSSGFFTTGESIVKITNIDTEGATFNVNIGYNDNSGNFIYDTQSKFIPQLSSATFTYTLTPDSFDQCSYNFANTPTKTTTEYKDVIKEKEVTEYRDETRYRKVTKTRTETREKEVRKTKIETRQKEVNWIFGFDALVKFRNLE
ncbi:hypothetical protein ISS07_00800 [Candidatus Woesearchaeota archaeon]|nr:hypothetical protein [Candidatus Woesearchaeota archaeon]